MITAKEIENKIKEAREYYENTYNIEFYNYELFKTEECCFYMNMENGSLYKDVEESFFLELTTPQEIFETLNKKLINKIKDF